MRRHALQWPACAAPSLAGSIFRKAQKSARDTEARFRCRYHEHKKTASVSVCPRQSRCAGRCVTMYCRHCPPGFAPLLPVAPGHRGRRAAGHVFHTYITSRDAPMYQFHRLAGDDLERHRFRRVYARPMRESSSSSLSNCPSWRVQRDLPISSCAVPHCRSAVFLQSRRNC